MNLGYVFSHGDGVLIATFVLLVAMSALSWYLIFWKALVLRQERQTVQQFKQQYMQRADWMDTEIPAISEGKLGILMQEWRNLQPSLAPRDTATRKDIVTLQLSQTLDHIRVQLEAGLTMLASIGSSAPFIGLFGTVWGIYGALTRIAAEGNASLNVVAGPMGEALVATAVGLFTAIPAVLAYNAYLRTGRLMAQDYRHIAERLTLISTLPAQQKRKGDDNLKLVAGE